MEAFTTKKMMLREQDAEPQKRKQRALIFGSTHLGHYALLIFGAWAVSFVWLYSFRNESQSIYIFNKYAPLRTIYGATAVGFCFAIALDVLAFVYALSSSKRTIAGLLAIVDIIALASYIVFSTTDVLFLFDSIGHPVWCLRYIGMHLKIKINMLFLTHGRMVLDMSNTSHHDQCGFCSSSK